MIKRDRDMDLDVECDECGRREPAGPLRHEDFMAELEDFGWIIVRGEQCEHYCPTCAGDHYREAGGT